MKPAEAIAPPIADISLTGSVASVEHDFGIWYKEVKN